MTSKSYLRRLLMVGLSLSTVRIVVLWFLIYRESSHHQSISLLPLILLLYPEGLWLPANFSWTWGKALGFSGVLLLGSFVLTTVLLGLMRALKV